MLADEKSKRIGRESGSDQILEMEMKPSLSGEDQPDDRRIWPGAVDTVKWTSDTAN